MKVLIIIVKTVHQIKENKKITVIINLKNLMIYIMKILIKHGRNVNQMKKSLHSAYVQKELLFKIHLLKHMKNALLGNTVIVKIR